MIIVIIYNETMSIRNCMINVYQCQFKNQLLHETPRKLRGNVISEARLIGVVQVQRHRGLLLAHGCHVYQELLLALRQLL